MAPVGDVEVHNSEATVGHHGYAEVMMVRLESLKEVVEYLDQQEVSSDEYQDPAAVLPKAGLMLETDVA